MNIQELMRQAQKMKQKIEKLQDELASKNFEGSAGGGMVVAQVSGVGRLVSVKIEKEVVNPDECEMLQDLVVAAVNQALTRASEERDSEMQKVSGGAGIPGMFG